eukprot:gi/632986060/ref/XP_007910027.1/ PREDICTED: paired immunoglobulin-like type 2 receptor beta [Callorhinchus milii]
MVTGALFLLQLLVVATSNSNFKLNQPESVSGMLGHSVTIPCQFSYPTEYRATKIRIYWRKYQFHGPFIFNVSEGYIHPNYSGRINFLGKPEGEKTGTIRINSLKQNDSSYYFCRVKTGGSKPQMWQSIPGTQLRVESHSTTGKTTEQPKCTHTHTSPQASRIPGSETNKDPGNETWIAVGCAVAVLLVIAIIVVVVWKRRKNANLHNKSEPNNKPADNVQTPHYTTITGSTGHDEEENTEGIVYAKLQIGQSNVTKVPLADQNTLYAAVDFRNKSS